MEYVMMKDDPRLQLTGLLFSLSDILRIGNHPEQ